MCAYLENVNDIAVFERTLWNYRNSISNAIADILLYGNYCSNARSNLEKYFEHSLKNGTLPSSRKFSIDILTSIVEKELALVTELILRKPFEEVVKKNLVCIIRQEKLYNELKRNLEN
jgi:hypothetical protein